MTKAGPDVRGHLYVLTEAGWELSEGPVQIPEGYYIIAPEPGDEAPEEKAETLRY